MDSNIASTKISKVGIWKILKPEANESFGEVILVEKEK